MKLEIVRMSEDIVDRTIFETVDKCRTFFEASAESRMFEIRGSFRQTRDGKPLGHLAGTEPLDLRKDEPHPVRALPAGNQLGSDLLVDRFLCIDESLKTPF